MKANVAETSSFTEVTPENAALPVPRRYLMAGLAAAALCTAAIYGALLSVGNQALALAALGGVALAASAWSFARFSGRGRLDTVVAEAVNKSAEATFVTIVPGNRSQPFVYANPAFHNLFKGDGGKIAWKRR